MHISEQMIKVFGFIPSDRQGATLELLLRFNLQYSTAHTGFTSTQ